MDFLNKKLKILVAIILFVIMGGFLLLTGVQHAKAATAGETWAMKYSRFVLSGFGIGDALGLYNPADIIYDQVSGSPPGTSAKEFQNACKLSLNPSTWVVCLLLAVLNFVGWLISIAASIFAWAADAKNLTAVINGPAIYAAWKIIRDFLNMAFILVLVYTAFTIIFQVDSTNKKRILTVVLMALLVNFSFPIARFIIDVGNSMMYTIFNNLFSGAKDPGAIYATITSKSQLGPILNPTDPTISSLLASIIFAAILAVTLLMMSVLFVIRIVALALVIIFSPIAFVGVAVPSFSSKASQWWDYLFKYTFFGPIMAFMLFIALTIMNTVIPISVAATPANEQPLLVAMSTFAIPIIILWIGMGFAQQMGIQGADLVTKQGKGALAWAGKKFSGYNAVKRQYDAFAGARKKRMDEKNKNRIGGKIGDKFNKWQDTAIGTIPLVGGAAKKRAEKMRTDKNRQDVEDKAKEVKAGSTTVNIVNNVNSSFDAAGNIVSATKDQAGNARAFTDRSSDDKKDFIEDQLANTGIGSWATNLNLKNILGNVAANPRVMAALNRVQDPTVINKDEKDLRAIATYISQQSEEVVKKYVNP